MELSTLAIWREAARNRNSDRISRSPTENYVMKRSPLDRNHIQNHIKDN